MTVNMICTTRIEHPLMSFSSISNAVIKVDEKILEVSNDGSIFVNGSNDASESGTMSPFVFDGYKLVSTTKGTKSNILVAYMLYLGHGRFVEIHCNKKTGMLFIDVGGTFSDSEGLLGNSGTEGLYSCDGSVD